jgi:hypothetical protein
VRFKPVASHRFLERWKEIVTGLLFHTHDIPRPTMGHLFSETAEMLAAI